MSTETPSAFISDGYTLDFDIPEQPGVSAGLSGRYRPMPNRELQTLYALNLPSSHKPPAVLPKGVTLAEWLESEIDSVNAKCIAKQLHDWNLVDQEGKSVEITPANVSRLYPPRLLADLTRVICGTYKVPQSLNSQAVESILMAEADPMAKLQAIQTLVDTTKQAARDQGADEKN
ncbi:MAG: hypothetical protein JWN70_6385 [Planctomycetaceae bacterium]|nr:hypothetical protein [Planctomycetaceae bacterium]